MKHRFEVGDRVIGVGIQSHVDITGMTGVVVNKLDGFFHYSVEFDNTHQEFHACGGTTKDFYGYYCRDEALEALIDEEPKWNDNIPDLSGLI